MVRMLNPCRKSWVATLCHPILDWEGRVSDLVIPEVDKGLAKEKREKQPESK